MAFGNNKKTGRPGPAPHEPRSGDMKQARARVNQLVKCGKIPDPNSISCADCGHVHKDGERRHEYDHYLGYEANHHLDVQSVCTKCHKKRDSEKVAQTHCIYGHEFTSDNTRIRANGTRECKICRRKRDRKRHDAAFWRRYRAKKARA